MKNKGKVNKQKVKLVGRKTLKMNKVLRNTLMFILTFIILICIYMLLLTITSLIPSSVLKENVRESSETLYEEGEKVTYDLKYKEENIFTFTDALMINTAYSIDSTHPIESFMLARKNYIPGQTKTVSPDGQYNLGANEKYINPDTGDLYQTKELYGLMHGDNIEDSYEYARYWHGYLVILRPLLALFNYEGIRIVLLIFTILSAGTLIVLLSKKINLLTGIIFAIGLLSVNILIVSRSINEILIFLVAFISSIFLLLKKDKIKNIGLFFFVVGSVSSFIDLLTTPLITLGLTSIIYFLMLQKNEDKVSVKKYIIELIKIGITWCMGYGLTWVSKWIITELIYGRPIVSQAIEQALFRSKLPTYKGQIIFGPLDVIERNLEFLSKTVMTIIAIIAITYIIVMAVKNYKKNIDINENLKKSIPYILIFFFPIIWYLALKQHSYTHVNFTYRLLCISVICLLLISSIILKEKEVSSKQTVNKLDIENKSDKEDKI